MEHHLVEIARRCCAGVGVGFFLCGVVPLGVALFLEQHPKTYRDYRRGLFKHTKDRKHPKPSLPMDLERIDFLYSLCMHFGLLLASTGMFIGSAGLFLFSSPADSELDKCFYLLMAILCCPVHIFFRLRLKEKAQSY